MKTFFTDRELPLEVLDPINNEVKHLDYRYTHTDSGFNAGCYIIKK
jgi:hypothetical protein